MPDRGSERSPVASLVVAALAAAGVREVYSVAGGALTPLLGAIAAQDVVRYVGVRHEFAAGAMAAATYQGEGRIAVCLGEQGPGTLNLVSGLGSAYNNNLAVLALTVSGDSRTARPGSGALMQLDAPLAMRAVTKHQFCVERPDDAPAIVAAAIAHALAGRPGPVHVDIPREVIGALVDSAEMGAADPPADPPAGTTPADTTPAGTTAQDLDIDITRAVRLLREASRPLVIAGGGAVDSADVLRSIAETIEAVTVTTQMGIGTLPSDGPLFAGQGGVIGGPALIRAAIEADVVLAVGCRFSSWWWRDGRLLVRGKIIRIDTDPEPLPKAPGALHLVGGAAPILERISAQLRANLFLGSDRSWAADVHADFVAHRARLDELASSDDGASSAGADKPAHPAALARLLGTLISPDDRVVLDGGHTTFWGNDFTPALRPRTVFHEPGMGHLGFGVPCANALALANHSRRVVTITGDGAFGFSLVELDTARRLGLRTITVVHNNEMWGVIGVAQRRAGFELGTDLSGTDYAAIANGFGCLGLRITDLAELPAAWSVALESELPVVLDVVVRFDPHPMMADFGRASAYAP